MSLELFRRCARVLSAWVLVSLLALQLGAVLAPEAFNLVCSSAGAGAKLVPASEGSGDQPPKDGHCAICSPAAALLSVASSGALLEDFDGSPGPAYLPTWHAQQSAKPPPARAPPLV